SPAALPRSRLAIRREWTRRFRSTKKDREAPARSAKHRRSAQAFLLWQKLQAAARSARWIREKVHQPEDRRTVRTRWRQFRDRSGDTILNFSEIGMVSLEITSSSAH